MVDEVETECDVQRPDPMQSTVFVVCGDTDKIDTVFLELKT